MTERQKKLEELRMTVSLNSEELQKLRRIDDEIARNTFEAQERAKFLNKELKAKGIKIYQAS